MPEFASRQWVIVQYVSDQPPLISEHSIVPAYESIVNWIEFSFLLLQGS